MKYLAVIFALMTGLAVYADTFTFIGTFDHETEVIPFAKNHGWEEVIFAGEDSEGRTLYQANPVTAQDFCKATVGHWLVEKLSEFKIQAATQELNKQRDLEINNLQAEKKQEIGSKITAVVSED